MHLVTGNAPFISNITSFPLLTGRNMTTLQPYTPVLSPGPIYQTCRLTTPHSRKQAKSNTQTISDISTLFRKCPHCFLLPFRTDPLQWDFNGTLTYNL
jgi:hypothetical protein